MEEDKYKDMDDVTYFIEKLFSPEVMHLPKNLLDEVRKQMLSKKSE